MGLEAPDTVGRRQRPRGLIPGEAPCFRISCELLLSRPEAHARHIQNFFFLTLGGFLFSSRIKCHGYTRVIKMYSMEPVSTQRTKPKACCISLRIVQK